MDSPERGGNGVYYLRGDLRRYMDPEEAGQASRRAAAGGLPQDAAFFASDM